MKNRTLAIIASGALLSGALAYHILEENLTPLSLLRECYKRIYLSSFQAGVSYVPEDQALKGYAVSLEKQNLLGLDIEKLSFTPYQSTNRPIRLTKYSIVGWRGNTNNSITKTNLDAQFQELWGK